MKKVLTKIISLCFAATILMSVSITAFAADQLTINEEAKVNVGDKVKFSLYLSECTEEVIGFEMRLFYDGEYLELNKDSITYEKFDAVIHNPNLENRVAVSWTNISQPADFSKKALFMSAEFKVLKAGDADISYFVTDMYGDDMTYLKSYKWTYDISVNDETIVSDKVPPISDNQEIINEKQGSFINYIDGMGEDNSPNKDEHQAVTGVVEVTQYKEVTKTTTTSGSMVYIIAAAAVIIVALAVVAIIVVKKRDDANLQQATNSLANDFQEITEKTDEITD